MANLVSAAEVQVLVTTSLSTSDLDTLIAREEAEIVDRYGPHYVDTNTAITETHVQEEGQSPADLFLRRPILSVSSVSEKAELTSDAVALTEGTHYVVVSGQGRLIRLGGLPAANNPGWGRIVTVSYVPQDDTLKRKQAIIELMRIAVARTAMQREDIAGEYSYTVPDGGWDAARERILRSVGYPRW